MSTPYPYQARHPGDEGGPPHGKAEALQDAGAGTRAFMAAMAHERAHDVAGLLAHCPEEHEHIGAHHHVADHERRERRKRDQGEERE